MSEIPGEKTGILFKKQHANPSSSLPLHSLLLGLLWRDRLSWWMRQTRESPFSSCLAPKSLAVAVPVWVGFPSAHLRESLPGWNFVPMLYLPSIKCQKRTRVCVFLYESGLQVSSFEHLLFGEVMCISNRSLVLPPDAKARLRWVVNCFCRARWKGCRRLRSLSYDRSWIGENSGR